MSSNGTVVPPGDGREVRIGPNRLQVKADGATGHRQVCVFEDSPPPGGGFPPHVYDDFEGVFYVLEGELEYLVDGDWVAATPGTTVCAPAGVVHAFRNATEQPAKHLVIHTPAVVGEMIDRLATAPPEQWNDVLADHNAKFV